MNSKGLFRNPFRATASARRSQHNYHTQHTNNNEGQCPYQEPPLSQRLPAKNTTRAQCLCCLRKFTFLERFLSLGQKRCHDCRAVICKRCSNLNSPGFILCHLCLVRQQWSGSLAPLQLLTVNERELIDILRILHYRETDFVGWPKSQLVKQILIRLDIYHDWDPAAKFSHGKSPKRRKRNSSREASEIKRPKTSSELSWEDVRTINLVDVINNETQKNEMKNEPDSTPIAEQLPCQPSTMVAIVSSAPQDQSHQKRRRAYRKDFSFTPRKFAASLRKNVYKSATGKPSNLRKRGSGVSLPIEDLCKICMDTIPNCVFLNCGHMVSCQKCAYLVNECPICRSNIVKVQLVYKS